MHTSLRSMCTLPLYLLEWSIIPSALAHTTAEDCSCRASGMRITLANETSPPISDALQGTFNLAWLGSDNQKSRPLPVRDRAAIVRLTDQTSTLSVQ